MENRFCLQMVSCGDGCCGGDSSAGGNVYSTEETVCGKWIDGKTIYRKVITGKLAEDSGNSIAFADVSDLKVETIVDLYGTLLDNISKAQCTLQTSYNRTNGILAATNMFYSNDGKIYYHYLNNNGNYSNCTATVIIEYTKK